MTAFIASHVDYCNAVFYGVAQSTTHRLQVCLNAAARLVTGLGKYDHITPVLRDTLHWLPVTQRVTFKIAVLAFDCVRGTCPAYFRGVCTPLADIPGRPVGIQRRTATCMCHTHELCPWALESFRVAAPVVWNALPPNLRLSTISRQQFLKTHLFHAAY